MLSTNMSSLTREKERLHKAMDFICFTQKASKTKISYDSQTNELKNTILVCNPLYDKFTQVKMTLMVKFINNSSGQTVTKIKNIL